MRDPVSVPAASNGCRHTFRHAIVDARQTEAIRQPGRPCRPQAVRSRPGAPSAAVPAVWRRDRGHAVHSDLRRACRAARRAGLSRAGALDFPVPGSAVLREHAGGRHGAGDLREPDRAALESGRTAVARRADTILGGGRCAGRKQRRGWRDAARLGGNHAGSPRRIVCWLSRCVARPVPEGRPVGPDATLCAYIRHRTVRWLPDRARWPVSRRRGAGARRTRPFARAGHRSDGADCPDDADRGRETEGVHSEPAGHARSPFRPVVRTGRRAVRASARRRGRTAVRMARRQRGVPGRRCDGAAFRR